MKTYRIDGVYINDYQDWLAIGCPEDQVGDAIDSYIEEKTSDGRIRFKKLIVTLED